MRLSTVVAMSFVVFACVSPAWAIGPPWELIHSKLIVSVGDDPFVEVGELFMVDETNYEIDVVCSHEATGQGLAFLVTPQHSFDSVVVTVTVVDEDGLPLVVDEDALTGDPVQDTATLLHQALQYNRLYSETLVGGSALHDIALAFRPEAVQFFSDDIGNPYSNSTVLAQDVFTDVCEELFFDDAVSANFTSAPKVPSAGHVDGFVPAAAHTAGEFGSFWTTDLWVYRESATTLDLWYNQVGASEAPTATVSLDASVVYLPDVVATLFNAEGMGSISYLADAPVTVVSRTWTSAEDGGTYGQMIPGVSVAQAARPVSGNDCIMRVLVNQREGFRANLGVANVSGDPVTLNISILTADGAAAPGDSTFTVDLEPWEMTQVNDVLARIDPGELEGLIVSVQAVAGGGTFVAYVSEVDNATNDPSYQEAHAF